MQIFFCRFCNSDIGSLPPPPWRVSKMSRGIPGYQIALFELGGAGFRREGFNRIIECSEGVTDFQLSGCDRQEFRNPERANIVSFLELHLLWSPLNMACFRD